MDAAGEEYKNQNWTKSARFLSHEKSINHKVCDKKINGKVKTLLCFFEKCWENH